MKKRLLSVALAFGSFMVGATVGVIGTQKAGKKEIIDKQGLAEKHLDMFLLMNQWVKLKQEGKHLQDYFVKNGYSTIAVYGLSYVGERLVDELKESTVNIKYGIDKSMDGIYLDIDTFTLEDDLENVDAIVVTPIYYFEAIKRELEKKVDCSIISIEDVVYDL